MSAVPARFAAMAPRPLVWRRSRFGTNADRVARALLVASALYLVLLLVGALVAPLRRPATRVVELPDREVALLIEEPEIAAPVVPEAVEPPMEQVAVRQVADPPLPEGIVNEPRTLPVPLREREPALDPDAGREGRRRAEEATARLAGATAALDGALQGLSGSLRDAGEGTPEPSRRRRARRAGGGRDDAALAGYGAGAPVTGAADLERSGVAGSIVAIGALAPVADASGGGDAEARARSAPSPYRSNASLMAVIQRYAAGIQFCYESELNRQPGLRGKLVVALTVSAAGDVSEATVTQNTLASSKIAACALAQIRQWKFPPVAGGSTSFQTPFVFTPPE